MTVMKSVARLTSSLLSRKGSAQPAVPAPHRIGLPPASEAPAQPAPQEPTASAPAEPVLVVKPAQWSTPGPRRGAPDRRQTGDRRQTDKKRVRVSLRLDLDRHRKLKLVAMQTGRTLQALLTQALDDYFKRHAPEVLEALGPTEDVKEGHK